MSFKFTLSREGKIARIIRRLIAMGTTAVNATKKFKTPEKEEAHLERVLYKEAVKILHNRTLDKMAKASRKHGVHNAIQAKHKAKRHKTYILSQQQLKAMKHDQWVQDHAEQLKARSQVRKSDLEMLRKTVPMNQLPRYERNVVRRIAEV